MGEAIFIFFLVAIPLGIAVWMGLERKWHWMSFLITIALSLGIHELVSKINTGRTLSQTFWIMATETPYKAWIFLGLMAGWGASVIWHLYEKNIKEPGYWKRKKGIK